MNPSDFTMNFAQVFEALLAIVVLSFLLERALALLYEWKPFMKRLGTKPIKTPMAFGLALMVAMKWDFDAIGAVFSASDPTILGTIITAGVIAGGSKASLKLFHDVMGVKSQAVKDGEGDD